jgi:invasion protein IalB
MLSIRFITVSRFALAMIASAPFGALAQTPASDGVSPNPEVTTASYGDWVLRCATQGADPKTAVRSCEVVQILQVQGQSAPIAQLAIGRPAPKAPMKFTAVLPTNITIATQPFAQLEDKAANQPLAWRRCATGGCIADADIRPEVLTAWRLSKLRSVLQFRDATGQDLSLPFSVRGLAQALDAMPKE